MDLSNFGLKNTKARECLINLLKESKDPKTAEELYLNLPQGLTNLSTVYRTLHTFCEAGIISKEIRPDGKALYSYSSFEHHHVLICIKCSKKIYLSDCPYKKINDEIYQETGFLVDNHHIELYGYCKDCQSSK